MSLYPCPDFFEHHPAPYLVVQEGRIRGWNPAFESAVGAVPQEITSVPLHHFRPGYGPDAEVVANSQMPARFLRFGDIVLAVTRAWGPGTAAQPQYLELAPPNWPGVTAAVIDQMPVGVGVACATTGHFIYANESLGQMIGETPQYLQQRRLQDIRERLHPDDLSRHDALAQMGLDASLEPNDGIVRMRHSDGHYQWTHRRVMPLLGDAAQGYLAALHIDVTQQKAREEEMRQQVALLEQVAQVLAGLLEKNPSEAILELALATLAESLGADRAFLNFFIESNEILRKEWCADGVPSLMDRIDWANSDLNALFPTVMRDLTLGRVVHAHVKDLPEPDAILLNQFGTLSFIIAPIFKGQKLIGLMGFDACAAHKNWSAFHTAALQAVAAALGTVWLRILAERRAGIETQKLNAVMANAQNPIVALDTEMRLMFYNSATEAIYSQFGTKPLLGEPLTAYGDQWALAVENAAREVLRTNTPVRFEQSVLVPGYPEMYSEVALSPIGEPGQPPIGVLSVVFDKTAVILQNLELSEALERFRLVSQAAPGGIWDYRLVNGDPTHADNQMWLSPRFFKHFAYKPETEFVTDPDYWSNGIHPDDRANALQAYVQHVLNADSVTMEIEYRFQCTDGIYRWVRDICATERDADGRGIRSVGLMTIIQEEREREERLRKYVNELEIAHIELQELNKGLALKNHLFDASIDAQFIAANGQCIEANAATLKMFGYDSAADLIGTTPLDVSPEYQPNGRLSRDMVQEYYIEFLKTGFLQIEWVHCRKDGTPFPVELTIIQYVHDGQEYALTVCRDVSDKKAYEQSLLQNLQDLQTAKEELQDLNEKLTLRNHLFDASGEAQLLTLNGVWVDANPAAAAVLGYANKDEIIGLGPWDVSPEYQTDGSRSEDIIPTKFAELARRGFIQFPWSHQRKDGTCFPAEVALTQLEFNGQVYVLAFIRDISERMLYQNKLVENLRLLEESQEATQAAKQEADTQRQRTEAIMNSLDDVILAFDKDLVLTHFNNTFRDTLASFGVQAQAGMPAQETLNEMDYNRSLPYLHRALGGDRIDTVFEFQYVDEGQTYFRHRKINPVLGPDGNVNGVVIYSRDITAQKWLEQESRARERRMEAQKSALHNLTRSDLLISGKIYPVTVELTKTTAETLNVNRVGLWVLNDEGLENMATYLLDASSFEKSPLLKFADAPEYYRQLFSNEVIIVNDTREGPLWDELGAYYEKEGITSMLDVPVHRGGEIVGVLCIEHKGPKRVWQPDEQRFAHSIAEMMSLALEARERLDAMYRLETATAELEAREEELRQNLEEIAAMQESIVQARDVSEMRRAQLEAVLNASQDLILALDENLCVTMLNEASRSLYNRLGVVAQRGTHFDEIEIRNDNINVDDKQHRQQILDGLKGVASSIEYEVYLQTLSRISYWVQNVNPIYDQQENIQGVLIVSRNITARKQAELDLIQKNEELEIARRAEQYGRRQLEAILNSTPDIIVAVDTEMNILMHNQSYAHYVTAQGRDAGVGHHLSASVRPEDWERSRPHLDAVLKGKYLEQEAVDTFNGEQFYRVRSFNPYYDGDGNVAGFVVFSRNITDRKLAELALAQKNAELEQEQSRVAAIINSSPDLIVAFDLDTRATLFNRAMFEFFERLGIHIKLGMKGKDAYTPELLAKIEPLWNRVFNGETFKVVLEQPAPVPNQSGRLQSRFFEVTYSPIRGENNEVTGGVGVSRDITDRVLFEEELRNKNTELELAWQEAEAQRFQIAAIINSTDDYIVAVNKNREMIYFNDSFRKLLAGNGERVEKGMFSMDSVNPEFRSLLAEYGEQALTGIQVQREIKYRFNNNGPYFYYDFSYTPMPNAMGEVGGYIIFAKDITQRKKAELELHYKNEELQTQQEELRSNLDQLEVANRNLEAAKNELNDTLDKLKAAQGHLVHAEKMSSLGQLTAGIAHEINNPINYVHNGVDALRDNLEIILAVADRYNALNPNDAPDLLAKNLAEIAEYKSENYYTAIRQMLPDVVDKIKIGSSRTAEIVRGLRNFSRLDEAELKQADIHEGLDSTLLLLGSRLKNTMKIDRFYDPKVPLIDCFAGQLNQVFMNIIGNAIDALEETKDPEAVITIRTLMVPDASQVVIAISDNGPGMPPDVLRRIFDPFFTTKSVGKGTGLGLSISYGIVEKHNGRIEVESTLGRGTTFHIVLPIRLAQI